MPGMILELPPEIFGGDHQEEEQRDPFMPEPLAQAMELRQHFARLMEVSKFKPGDIVREKRYLGPLKAHLRVVMVVVRHLDTSEYDQSLVLDHVAKGKAVLTAMQPDLVCADIFRSHGKQLLFDLKASCTLEHVSDDELAQWERPPAEE